MASEFLLRPRSVAFRALGAAETVSAPLVAGFAIHLSRPEHVALHGFVESTAAVDAFAILMRVLFVQTVVPRLVIGR
jgi:hypothetical protein